MPCTSLCSIAGRLMRRMSPCTRIMGGRPEDRCRSEALFLTTKARSSEISTIIPFNVRPERNPEQGPKQMKEREFSGPPRSHRRADYVLNTLELASREAAHRIRDPGGGQASPIGAIGRGEQDVSAGGGARGGAGGIARFRRELRAGGRRKDPRALIARAHLALHRPDPEQQDARDRGALRLGPLDRPCENRRAARASARPGAERASSLYPGQRVGRGDQERRRPFGSGAPGEPGGGVAALEAARSHGGARADTRRGTAAPAIRATARATRPAEPRRLCDGHALDGHVGGPRGGDRRRRDSGTGGYGDFWRKARLSLS